MTQGKYRDLSVAQRADVWRRWKAGESLHTMGRAFDRPHTSIHCLSAHHGGIVPALRQRGLLALPLAEREEISRGMASGSSIRDIAKGLEPVKRRPCLRGISINSLQSAQSRPGS
jgi:hypothetical protein